MGFLGLARCLSLTNLLKLLYVKEIFFGVFMDYFLYSGDLARGDDLKFIEFVASEKKSDQVAIILCTPGGAPDAAYKIGRYLQGSYSDFKLFVPGLCKCPSPLKLGHYTGHRRGTLNGEETTFRRRCFEAAA